MFYKQNNLIDQIQSSKWAKLMELKPFFTSNLFILYTMFNLLTQCYENWLTNYLFPRKWQIISSIGECSYFCFIVRNVFYLGNKKGYWVIKQKVTIILNHFRYISTVSRIDRILKLIWILLEFYDPTYYYTGICFIFYLWLSIFTRNNPTSFVKLEIIKTGINFVVVLAIKCKAEYNFEYKQYLMWIH